jgi:hypothetical protein
LTALFVDLCLIGPKEPLDFIKLFVERAFGGELLLGRFLFARIALQTG